MAKSIIGTGSTANDGTGDTLRAAGIKINDNFSEVYTALGDGTTLAVATVATTGSYNDLSDTPTIPADLSDLTDTTNLIPADVSDLTDTTELLPAGGQGHMFMIDTNRTDTYTEVGSADKPFKTFAAAIAAADLIDTTVTFVIMGCTVSETVDFGGTSFTQITIATSCRSVITGDIIIDDNSAMSQMFFRNIEVGGDVTITGDGTAGQFNSVNFYNTSFSGAVNITATNATAFYEVSFFGAVNITNVNYIYVNGAQFNDDLTITVDDDGVTPVPSSGIAPSVILGFNFIANDVYLTKVGSGASFIVFQPHMARMGTSGGTYTIPANFIFQPQGCAIRGTWTNNGSTTLRNTSFDVAMRGTEPTYTGVLGGDRIVLDSIPATSAGAVGDREGMIAADGSYLYVCTADYTDGLSDIWSRTAVTASNW
jgi:hypothetical protein